VVGVLLLAVALVWDWHERPMVGNDDANIFFSYAENLAAGHGFSYAGNGERVEGFTSMLWTILCAGSFWLGLDEAGVWLVSLLCFVATHLLMLQLIKRLASARDSKSIGSVTGLQFTYLALVLSSPSYIAWNSIVLMDTVLWGMLVVGMLYAALFAPVEWTGWTSLLCLIPFLLAPLSRPESMVAAPGLVGLMWLRIRTAHPGKSLWESLRIPLITGACVAAVLLGLILFRLWYFGYPLPNTYYAKVSPSFWYNLREGREYLREYLQSGALAWGLSLLAICCMIWWCGDVWRRWMTVRRWPAWREVPIHAAQLVALAGVMLLVIPVLVGGDYFVLFRFFQPAWPVLCLLAAMSVGWLLAVLKNSRSGWGVTGVAVVTLYWLLMFGWDLSWGTTRWSKSPMRFDFSMVPQLMERGRTLEQLFNQLPDYPAVGVIAAGGLARTYPGRIVDTMGLNTPEFAHHREDRTGIRSHSAFDADVFFSIEPDVLLVPPPDPGGEEDFSTIVLRGLFFDPRFVERWRYGKLSLHEQPDVAMTEFFRADFVDGLLESGAFVFDDVLFWTGEVWRKGI